MADYSKFDKGKVMALQVYKLTTLLVILTIQSTSFAQSTINEEARKVYAAAGMS